MKILKIISKIFYLTDITFPWRGIDYKTNKMIDAVKGETINGYFQISRNKKTVTYDQKNINDFLDILYEHMGQYLGSKIEKPFIIVPIPNSSALRRTRSFRTLELSQGIANSIEHANVVDALRWKKDLGKSHKGGSRDPDVLYDNLQLIKEIGGPVVLFDDVMTSGAHIIAAHRLLSEAGVEVILGLTIGRVTKEQKNTMIEWHEEDLIVEYDVDDLGEW